MFQQGTLFPREPQTRASEVSGLSLRFDFVDPEEERALLQYVETGPWENDWRRRIQQYGVGYSSGGGKGRDELPLVRRPAWVRNFPDWLRPLARRVAEDAQFERFPENCVISEYIPPLGIAPHRDYPAF